MTNQNSPKHSGSLDRRPIAARSYQLSKLTTDTLAKWGATPNSISVASMIFGFASALSFTSVAGSTFMDRILLVSGAFFILLRLLANMFDGMVAVKTGATSPVGELYNEIPDRASDSLILIGCGYCFGGWPEAGYLAAITAMLTAYIRAVGKGAGAPQEFCGPFAKQQRMFSLIACALFLAITPTEWHPSFSFFGELGLPPMGLMGVILVVIALGSLYTSWRRVVKIHTILLKGM